MSKETTTQTPAQASSHIDYKDIIRLKHHVNPHARMYGRRRTSMSAKQQRDFARAIKRPRFMALMPSVTH